MWDKKGSKTRSLVLASLNSDLKSNIAYAFKPNE